MGDTVTFWMESTGGVLKPEAGQINEVLPSLNHWARGGRLGRFGTTTMLHTRLMEPPSTPKLTAKRSSRETSSLLGWICVRWGTGQGEGDYPWVRFEMKNIPFTWSS